MSRAPVILAPYDPAWPGQFASERTRLLATAGSAFIGIEHVGSTAVPGCCAKPILDIMAGLRSLGEVSALIQPLAELGYEYLPEHEKLIPQRRFFARPAGLQPRTHHLHVVEPTSSFWRDHLLFRDWLRTHPEDVLRYEHLKRTLAKSHQDDRAAYTQAKTGFVESIVAQARAAAGGSPGA